MLVRRDPEPLTAEAKAGCLRSHTGTKRSVHNSLMQSKEIVAIVTAESSLERNKGVSHE